MKRKYLTVIFYISGFIIQIIGYLFEADLFIKFIFMVFGLMIGVPALIIGIIVTLKEIRHTRMYLNPPSPYRIGDPATHGFALLYITVIFALDLFILFDDFFFANSSPITYNSIFNSIPLLIFWNISGLLWLIGVILYRNTKSKKL
jgi:hypothetical protein